MPMSESRSRWAPLGLVLGLLCYGTAGAGPEPLFVQDTADPSSGVVSEAASWDGLAISSAKSSITTESGALRVFLAQGDHASFSRVASFGSQPSALVCRFNVSIAEARSNAVAAQVLRLGSGFTSSNRDEPDANTYARIGVNTVGSGDAFQMRDLVAHRDSPTFHGTQAITWVLNRSGGALSYAAPNGQTETIGKDHMDVWVGREKVFDESGVTNPSAAISNLKWHWSSGWGVTVVDRFQIDALVAGAGSGVAELAAPAAAVPVGSGDDVSIELYRPTPNPFAQNVRYAYALAGSQRVDIGVFDLAGRRVRSLVAGTQAAGQYEARWDGLTDDGARVNHGIYFLRAAIGLDRHVSRLVYLAR